MGIRILDVESAIEDNGLKIMVYGHAGAGKTLMTATANQHTIILSAEGGLLSLKKKIKENPKLSKLLKVIPIKTIDDLEESLEYFKDSKKRLCNWICLDSISEIAEVILSEEKELNKDGRAAYGNLTNRCLEILRDFRDLPYYNVLMTAKMVRLETDDGKMLYQPLFPGKGIGNNIPYLFDEVFALRVEEIDNGDGDVIQKRILQTSPDSRYIAKDRSGELNDFEPPNLAKIFKKIRGFDEVNFEMDSETQEKYAEKIKELEPYEIEGEVISKKTQYWYHKGKDACIETEEDTDVSSLLNDPKVKEITKAKYQEWLEAEAEADAELESNRQSAPEEDDVSGEEIIEEEIIEVESEVIPKNETKLQRAQREMREGKKNK